MMWKFWLYYLFIILQDENIAQEETISILSCQQARDFWVSWAGGHIAVGTGLDVGHSSILSWTDPEFEPFDSVTLSTGSNVEGHWWIGQEQGIVVRLG